MKLSVSREDLRALADGFVPERIRERAKTILDPVPAVIPGQTDLEDMLAEGPHSRPQPLPEGMPEKAPPDVLPTEERSAGRPWWKRPHPD